MKTRETVLKNSVRQLHNAPDAEIHTVANTFDSLENYVAADVEWAHYVDAERRESYYAQVYYYDEPDGPETWLTVRYHDLDDFLVIDDSAIERVAEASEYPADRLHAELDNVDDSTPVEFVAIRDNLASLFGIESADIQSADQLAEAMCMASQSNDGYPHTNETYKHRQRGPYTAEETSEYVLDKFLYRNVPAVLAADRMLIPEHWYDGDTRQKVLNNVQQ